MILALSNQPLTLKQLDTISQECLSVSISDAFLLNKNAVSILVNVIHDETLGDLYEIRHEKLKELIEKDEENAFTRETLLDAVEMKLDGLEFSDMNLFNFLRENKSCQYLINSYFRNRKSDDKDIEIIHCIASRVSSLSWGELGSDNIDEQAFLLVIVNLRNFVHANDLDRAIILTRIAIDEMNMAYLVDSYTHAQQAYDLFNKHINKLNERQMLFYANLMETRCNVSNRLGADDDWFNYIQESLKYVCILYNKGFIPLREYTNVYIATASVDYIVNDEKDRFFAMLKEINTLLEASDDDNDLGQKALLMQRHSNVARKEKDIETFRKETFACLEAYRLAFEKAPQSFFLGCYYEQINHYFDCLDKDNTTVEEAKKIVRKYLDLIEQMSKAVNFYFPADKALVYHHIANMFLRLDDNNSALFYLNKALNSLAEIGKTVASSSDFVSKHKRSIMETIERINKATH